MHRSVLLHESIDSLNLGPGKIVVDATVGGGGHTHEIARRFGSLVSVYAFDADETAIARTKERLLGVESVVTFFPVNFRYMRKTLENEGVTEIDAALFDLGWSQDQIEISGRGFSFQHDEPLIMSYDARPDKSKTAEYLVNHLSERELADLIFTYGEERHSRNIARAIVRVRARSPIQTTLQLVDAIREGYTGRYPRSIHFATKTFQALRIAVNDEFGAMTEGMSAAFDLLRPGGRLSVISFHSSEDRIVKQYCKSLILEKRALAVTKKPIVPSTEELVENRRARSAKLRTIQKI